VTFPDLADQLTDDIYSERLSLSAARRCSDREPRGARPMAERGAQGDGRDDDVSGVEEAFAKVVAR
jgi:hypothetical protein